MFSDELKPGDIRIGHIVDDSNDEFPDQVGVLMLSADGRLELSLPFGDSSKDSRNPHYKKTRNWFEGGRENAPGTLLFFDTSGWVTLADLEWGGVRTSGGNNGNGVGKFVVGTALLGRPKTFESTYLIKKLSSTIDGLAEFTRFSPIDLNFSDPHSGRTITVKPDEVIEWELGAFRYRITSSVSIKSGNISEVRDQPPRLETIHETGVPIAEHLEAQRPIRGLLTLIFGTKLSWRSHKALSESFPVWTWTEPTEMIAYVDVELAATSSQQFAPALESSSLSFSPARVSDIGAAGLRKWVELYADEMFRRAVQPAVEVFSGASNFVEPQFMMLTISLDYLGYFRMGDQRRYQSSVWVQKAIDDTGLTWPGIGTSKGIAEAIVRVNNDLKHPNRETDPSPEELYGLTELARVVVRAQIYDLLNVNEEIVELFRSMGEPQSVKRFFAANRIQISDSGDFIHRT